jgi:hypothetical protein
MPTSLRTLARRFLAVERTATYYLPWLTRPGLDCVLILNNIESRFKTGFNEGPFRLTVTQHDADGSVVRRYTATLADSTDVVELRLTPTLAGCGFVTVEGERLLTDLYVSLSNGEFYTVTHGRGEFVEQYPRWVRGLAGVAGGALAVAGRTVAAFTRDQYVHVDADSRSHLLVMNLSNITNRIRASVRWDGRRLGGRLVTLPPMGAMLLDVGSLAPGRTAAVRRVRLEGNAWFNIYLVGAGPRDLAGPLSLMHVK